MNLKNTESTQFKPGHRPQNAGRKKNLFKKFQEIFDLSGNDVSAISKFVLSKTRKDLEKICEDKNQPVLLVIFSEAVVGAIKKGDLRSIEYMLDRSIGKVADKLDLSADAKVRIEITKELLSENNFR